MLYVTDHVSFSKNVAKYRMNNALYFNVNIYTYETKRTARKGAVKRNFKASKGKARSKKSLRSLANQKGEFPARYHVKYKERQATRR